MKYDWPIPTGSRDINIFLFYATTGTLVREKKVDGHTA